MAGAPPKTGLGLTPQPPSTLGMGLTPPVITQHQPLQIQAQISQHALAQMSAQQQAQYMQAMQAQMNQQLAQAMIQANPAVYSIYTSPVNNSTYITGTVTTTNTTAWINTTGTGTTGSNIMPLPYGNQPIPGMINQIDPYDHSSILSKIFKVQAGMACEIQLPDGSKIKVDDNGSYVIDDKDAKVVYRANRARDFNKFINVSDRIEEFFEFCGQQEVEADEMMELPMKLFVGWLVLKAAEADMEEPPDIKLIPDLHKRTANPRCRSCGRFIRYAQKKANMEFCNAVCFDKKLVEFNAPTLPPLQALAALPAPSPSTGLPQMQEPDLASHEMALCPA